MSEELTCVHSCNCSKIEIRRLKDQLIDEMKKHNDQIFKLERERDSAVNLATKLAQQLEQNTGKDSGYYEIKKRISEVLSGTRGSKEEPS